MSAGGFVNLGPISGIDSGAEIVLASFSPSTSSDDGQLYIVGQGNNTIYTVDPGATDGPVATVVPVVQSPSGLPSGVSVGDPVQGADIAFPSDSTTTAFLYSNNSSEGGLLLTLDVTTGATEYVGTTGDFYTGLAIRADGVGNLVGSNTDKDAVVSLDKSTGAEVAEFPLRLNGSAYSYGFGDMTLGRLVFEPACVECTSEELLAKYEFDCVEEVDGECIEFDFLLEAGDGDLVSYVDFTSKDDEAFEPVTASFETEFCSVYAVVKAGPEIGVQELIPEDGAITAENIGRYAISFVAFYCTEEAGARPRRSPAAPEHRATAVRPIAGHTGPGHRRVCTRVDRGQYSRLAPCLTTPVRPAALRGRPRGRRRSPPVPSSGRVRR